MDIGVSSVLFVLLLLGCVSSENPSFVVSALTSGAPSIEMIMDDLGAHEVQVQVSKILDKPTSTLFVEHSFQVEDSIYFYPASTVKLPIALFAIEYVNSMAAISSETTFLVAGDSLKTTVRKEVKKIFAIRDASLFGSPLTKDHLALLFKGSLSRICPEPRSIGVKGKDAKPWEGVTAGGRSLSSSHACCH